MEQVTISMSENLKAQIEKHLETFGMTWTEMLEDVVGKEASPSVDKALREAYESGVHSKRYSTAAEMFNDILGDKWDA